MNKIKLIPADDIDVNLIHYTPIRILIKAIRTTTHTLDKLDNTARNDELIKLIFQRSESPLEHIVYTFEINGISRALLQELVRHRIASYSVQSTRFALKRIINNDVVAFRKIDDIAENQEKLYLSAISEIAKLMKDGERNDKIKYLIPEALLTNLMMTINARSLKNLLTLRMSKRALGEFRVLANKIHNEVIKVHNMWEELEI